jgi:hypothetical protein
MDLTTVSTLAAFRSFDNMNFFQGRELHNHHHHDEKPFGFDNGSVDTVALTTVTLASAHNLTLPESLTTARGTMRGLI